MKTKRKTSEKTREVMKSMLCDNTISISEIVQNMANRGYGLGRIFNHIRAMKTTACISDLIILKLILLELSRMEKLPSKTKIRHHFRTKVSKDEYNKRNKRSILKEMYHLDP